MTAHITYNDKPVMVEFEYLGDGRPPFTNDEINISEVYFKGANITDFLSLDVVAQIENSVCIWLREVWIYLWRNGTGG